MGVTIWMILQKIRAVRSPFSRQLAGRGYFFCGTGRQLDDAIFFPCAVCRTQGGTDTRQKRKERLRESDGT